MVKNIIAWRIRLKYGKCVEYMTLDIMIYSKTSGRLSVELSGNDQLEILPSVSDEPVSIKTTDIHNSLILQTTSNVSKINKPQFSKTEILKRFSAPNNNQDFAQILYFQKLPTPADYPYSDCSSVNTESNLSPGRRGVLNKHLISERTKKTCSL